MKSALIIGGSGQIGRAAAARLGRAGWSVTLASRSGDTVDARFAGLDVRSTVLDRNDTAAVHAAAAGQDLVVDTVAFTPAHGAQLTGLAGETASLVVISTGAVYQGSNGTTSETAEGDDQFPEYPVPIPEEWQTLPPGGTDYGSAKADLERTLLAADDLPVTILRPGTLHGPYSTSLHQWSFIKRALDGRTVVPLAYDGKSRFSTSAADNVARLIQLAAEQPGKRVLNAADDDALTVEQIGRRVFALMGHEAEFVTFPGGPKEGRVGFNPWGIPRDIVLDMGRARTELGYEQAIGYDDALREDIDWAVAAVHDAEAAGRDWTSVFPGVVARYGADGWFPYDAEDAYLASR
ncbi:MAG: NAD(P)H-binding protein [Microbacterium sp.]|uniref:NAD-dependent epimerase/dehydratase family protein n=1 Tax=Microbacterium sp. TaxID=51671 RepID=UPI0039E3C46D